MARPRPPPIFSRGVESFRITDAEQAKIAGGLAEVSRHFAWRAVKISSHHRGQRKQQLLCGCCLPRIRANRSLLREEWLAHTAALSLSKPDPGADHDNSSTNWQHHWRF
jgi:hypothetical protein